MKLWRSIQDRYWQHIGKRINRKAYLHYVIKRWYFDDDAVAEARVDLRLMDTKEWLKRAEQVRLHIHDIPIEKTVGDYWQDRFDDYATLKDYYLRQLQQNVEAAEDERTKRKAAVVDLRLKYLTAVGAVVAAIAGIINLYMMLKKK